MAMAGRSASGSWFGYFGVVHADVEVQLLRVGRVGPARRDPFGNALECQLPQAKLGAYDHPVTEIFVHPHPERLAVKLRERAGVRTVDYCLFKAADHSPSLPLRDRARALIVRTQRTMRLGRAVRGRCGRLLPPSWRGGGSLECSNAGPRVRRLRDALDHRRTCSGAGVPSSRMSVFEEKSRT